MTEQGGLLTEYGLNSRNYTYVSLMRVDEDGINRWESFLVASPFKRQALLLAKQYFQKQNWVFSEHCEDKFNLYPRNYIRKSRILFSEGKF